MKHVQHSQKSKNLNRGILPVVSTPNDEYAEVLTPVVLDEPKTSKEIKTINNLSIDELNKFMEKFIDFCGGSSATKETYRRSINAFFRWVWNTYSSFANIDRETVIAFREYLTEKHSSATIALYVNTAKRFLSFLQIEGLFPLMNLSYIKTPKTEKVFKKQWLTEEKAQELIRVAKKTSARDYALIMLLLTGVLRTVEVNRATVSDITTNMGEPVLYVQGKGHTSKDDYIRLTKETKRALDKYLSTRKDDITATTAPLFISTRGTDKGCSLSTRSIRKIVKDLLKKIGIDDQRITAHSLRHTGVTLALENGATFREAQLFARHKDIKTTQIYAHELETIRNNSCNIVEKVITKNLNKKK